MASDDSSDKRPPRKATRARRKTTRAPYQPAVTEAPEGPVSSARELYHREKARRVDDRRPKNDGLEQAKHAYQALLAKDAANRKGGRPKKTAAPKMPDESDDA